MAISNSRDDFLIDIWTFLYSAKLDIVPVNCGSTYASPLDPSSDYFHGFCTEVGKKEGQFRIINATSFINYQFFALARELRTEEESRKAGDLADFIRNIFRIDNFRIKS